MDWFTQHGLALDDHFGRSRHSQAKSSRTTDSQLEDSEQEFWVSTEAMILLFMLFSYYRRSAVHRVLAVDALSMFFEQGVEPGTFPSLSFPEPPESCKSCGEEGDDDPSEYCEHIRSVRADIEKSMQSTSLQTALGKHCARWLRRNARVFGDGENYW